MAVETDTATTPPAALPADAVPAQAAAHGTTAEAEHSAGLPQFQFQHWGGQIGYMLILFVVLYVLIAKVFAPRVRRVLDERTATIEGAIATARTVQAEAEAQAEAARKALADARSAAARTAAEATAKAEAEMSARKGALEAELAAKQAEAEQRIRAARDSAMQSLTAVATDTAEAMLEKLTGAKVPRDVIAAAAQSQG